MKIRTLDDLSDKLSYELGWRKKELTGLKYLLDQNKSDRSFIPLLARCGVVMLYAHWEGFIKICSRCYLEFIAMQRHCNSQLKENLLTLSMRSAISFNNESKKSSEFGKITNFFLTQMNARSSIPFKTAINTESNLSSSVLKEIIWTLNLNYSLFESKEKFIDAKLLGQRNHIAHGNDIALDADDYCEWRKIVLDMMTTFKNEIENNAVTKSYLNTACMAN
ncbi:MAE_28990/MAE_18760 family HEPN-like nuclease [Dethiosulfatarculus sandiegensis]|uniref:RiboL-PSP-HEPN domain-containing protein n=1 Tax=Dethiosulfatarculus sandiegensis TaxID=1429043 RepID=A0A0D2J3A5_9BACT|nr:MAE_28990/MAE_18760 family HEPN-like nuclease [Dethiosulfatarculus sandiegensis]KIX12679.1 hypothetical protein X474_17845 [Dethiosulfatarculus sandiegensis]